MSRNAYSLRGRGGSEPPEKRQRVGLGVEGASCVVYLGNVPKDWNEQIVRSVVAGSGNIVDIRVRIDPSGRSKNFVFVEYSDPQEAQKGVDSLSQVTLGPNRKFRVELSREGLRTVHKERPPLQLNRDHLPFYVTLPPAMLRDGPTPSSHYQQQNEQTFGGISKPVISQSPNIPTTSTTPAVTSTTQPKVELPVPEVLAKASQFLPGYNVDAFTMEDKISQNLQSLAPPQMIELIATLKTLISVNPNMAQQAFSVSPNIPIAAAQALVLMGLVDPNVITTALQVTAPSSAIPTTTGMISTPGSSVATPVPTQLSAHNAQPLPDPRWPTLPGYVGVKLAKLPPTEAATIAQVLQLSADVVNSLAPDQRQLVENIRRQYL